MKAIKTILFLAVIFIIVSCEKTEMIDSKINPGVNSKKCKMIYIFNPEPTDSLLRVLFTTVDSLKIDKRYAKVAELPEYLNHNTGYIVNVLNDSKMKYLAVFNIEQESEMIIEIRKLLNKELQ